MGKKYDIVISRKYQSGGQEKTAYTNIGFVGEKDGKFYIKLSVVPVGWDGFASLFEPRAKEGAQPAQKAPQQPALGNLDDFDDDIPF